jgi:DNA-binding transcriptional ArsR family regulator
MYNEQNVLRFEMTMNDPTRFRIQRAVQGKPDSDIKLLPMRKGIADIGVRAKVSSDRIKCFTEQMATVTEPVTFGELIADVSVPVFTDGKRYRALDVTGKDLVLLQAVADPKYSVDAISNKLLKQALERSPWANGLSGKKLSARISRHLRLLREHGLIRKLPKQHRYLLTDKGRKLTSALNQVLAVSIEDLAKLSA